MLRGWKVWLLAGVFLGAGCGGGGGGGGTAAPASTGSAPVAAPTAAPTMSPQEIADNFGTSLHGTRTGKPTWYDDGMPAQGRGFATLVDTKYSDLPCMDCHDPSKWEKASPPRTWQDPSCADCHQSTPGDAVAASTCYGCHSRQATEVNKLKLTDVHRDSGMGCMDCHSSGDVHGDGKAYASMMDPGAIDAKCQNCHNENALAKNTYHTMHMSTVDCSTCHMQTVVACYNCHFDSEANHIAKLSYGAMGGGWRYLVNRVVDEKGTTKVFPGSMQSLQADEHALDKTNGATFVAIGPYYSHSIARWGIKGCTDCHSNANVKSYFANGTMDVVRWDPATKKLKPPSGVIPIPPVPAGEALETYLPRVLKFDFVDLVTGPDGKAILDANGQMQWTFFKAGADRVHMPSQYVRPLTEAQMEKLR